MTVNSPADTDLPILKVCPHGFSERSLQTLTVFFERQLADQCLLAPSEQADVNLIDFDSRDAARLLAEALGNHPGQPVILLALNPDPARVPDAIWVGKPVKLDILLDILKDLRSQKFQPKQECRFSAASEKVLSARLGRASADAPLPDESPESTDHAARHLNSRESHFYIGSMPDVDLGNPAERDKAFYDPSHFLQGFVQKAINAGIENASVVQLSGAAFGTIEIYPFARKAITHTAASSLYAAGRLPLQESDVRIELLAEAPQFPLDEKGVEPLDAFLWKLALWASRGRLPLGTDPDMPVILKRWPNLTRLLVSPHATRIAGLWAREPMVLSHSVTVLGIPQRYVFAFYSACVAHGIVAPAQRALDALLVPEPPRPHEKRNLFRMLMNKLIGSREE